MSAAKRPRVNYFNMGPWPYFVGFTMDPDAFDREMRRLGLKGIDFLTNNHCNATTHFLRNKGTALAIICIASPRGPTREQYAAMLAHEAVHVIQDMKENLGDLGCEAEAYLVQQIVQESLQIAWKTHRSIRRAPVR